VKLALVIDGSGFIFRAFFGYPHFTTSNGTPINAVHGVCSMLCSVVSSFDYTSCVIALDRGRQTFRTQMYADYKSHRPELPSDLRIQLPIIRQAYESFGFHIAEQDGYEADDLIATYTKNFESRGYEVCVISSDKDLMQLVNDRTHIYEPMKKKKIDINGVLEKFGVYPHQIVDFLALLGDAADNVPGVDGVGQKTAAKLLQEYQTIEGIYENIEKITSKKVRESLIANKDRLMLARKLVTLEAGLPFNEQRALSSANLRHGELINFCKKHELNNLAKKIESDALRTLYQHNNEAYAKQK